MELIEDERLRAIVAATYPPGERVDTTWKGPTAPPSAAGEERDRWYARVARRRSAVVFDRAVDQPAWPAGISVSEVSIPVEGTCGRDDCSACVDGAIAAFVYRREERRDPRPAYVNLHGGAFWLGGGEAEMRASAPLWATRAAAIGATVIDVDYRMAPEHKFPTPPEDCFAALTWIVAYATELGIDPQRIAIGGTSAGGALTAAVTLMARDRGGPSIVTQVLVIPVIDSGCNTASMRTFASGYVFERQSARDMWGLYLAQPHDAYVPYASPAHSDDLGALPPALVVVADYDPLLDEGLTYAARLAAAGVMTTVRSFPMCHGAALPETTAEVERTIVAHLRAAFASEPG